MARILVGDGSAQAVVEVSHVPEVGEEITVARVVASRTSNADLLQGNTYVVTGENPTTPVRYGCTEETLRWFNIRAA